MFPEATELLLLLAVTQVTGQGTTSDSLKVRTQQATVRKRQKRSSMNVTEDGEKHSVMWGMFMSLTLQSSVFMGKNYSDNWHSIKNTKDLTMKQMFDISEKLVSEQDEIYGVKTIDWECSSWKQISLVSDEEVISLQRTKVYVFFRFCIMPWKGEREPTIKYCIGTKIGVVQKVHPEYRTLDKN